MGVELQLEIWSQLSLSRCTAGEEGGGGNILTGDRVADKRGGGKEAWSPDWKQKSEIRDLITVQLLGTKSRNQAMSHTTIWMTIY